MKIKEKKTIFRVHLICCTCILFYITCTRDKKFCCGLVGTKIYVFVLSLDFNLSCPKNSFTNQTPDNCHVLNFLADLTNLNDFFFFFTRNLGCGDVTLVQGRKTFCIKEHLQRDFYLMTNMTTSKK